MVTTHRPQPAVLRIIPTAACVRFQGSSRYAFQPTHRPNGKNGAHARPTTAQAIDWLAWSPRNIFRTGTDALPVQRYRPSGERLETHWCPFQNYLPSAGN